MLGHNILFNVTSTAITTNGEKYDDKLARAWMAEYWWTSIVVSILYLSYIWLGGILMRNREPIRAQKAFNVWNIILATYSSAAFYALWPEFLSMLKAEGMHGTYCINDGYWQGTTGFWVFTFHWSKILELGDTAFLVLRKRRVIFLHWYHHIIVFVCSWYCYDFQSSSVRFGTIMNLFVHSIMYTYYALHGLGLKMPKFVSMSITSLQILQFIVGLYICTRSAIYVIMPELNVPCDINLPTAYIQTGMYVSFLALFIQFFYNSYLKPKKIQPSKKVQ